MSVHASPHGPGGAHVHFAEDDGGEDVSGSETSGSTSGSSSGSGGSDRDRTKSGGGVSGWFRGWVSQRSSGATGWEAFPPPTEQSRELYDLISQRDALNARIQELQLQARAGPARTDLSRTVAGVNLEFLDRAMESQWRTVGIRHNTRLGARVFVVFLLAMLMQQVFVYLSASLDYDYEYDCGTLLKDATISPSVVWRLSTQIVALLTVPALCHLVLKPRFSCYLVCVLVLFTNSVLIGISPFNSFCTYPDRAAFCGAGHDCMSTMDNSQRVMSWILLCIWVVPEYRYMRYTWVFIWANLFTLAVEMKLPEGDEVPSDDATNDLLKSSLFFVGVNMIAIQKKWYFEKRQRTRFMYAVKHKEVSRKLYYILGTTTPQYVVTQLIRDPGSPLAETIEKVSVMFILIADFDKFANSRSGNAIVTYLNKYFCLLDAICEDREVTKIETVGEEYVCAVGVVPDDRSISARGGHKAILGRLVRVAQDVLDLQAESCSRDDETQQVAFKMGIHTGPVTAGIVGQRLPRFRLFGDTMNTAARMMQKASKGEVQFGEETRRELDAREVPIVAKGPVEMKGKGLLDVYVLGARPYSAQPHYDASSDHIDSDGGAFDETHIRATTGNTASTRGSRGNTGPPLGTFRAALEGVAAADRPLQCVRCASDAMDEDALDNFDSVLQDLGGHGSAGGGLWRYLRPGPEASVEEELVFQEWFFHSCVMNKLPQRLTKMAIVLVVLTATEAVYVLFSLGCFWSLQSVAKGLLKLSVFLGCRAIVLVVILIWHKLVRCKCSILMDATWCQRYLVMSYTIVVFMIYISYDATPQRVPRDDEEQKGSPLVLMSFPVYVLVVTAHRLLFVHSLVLLALALVLMLLETYVPGCEFHLFGSKVSIFSGIFLSLMGRLLFLTYNLIPCLEAYVEESSLRQQHRAGQAIMEAKRRMGGVLDTLMPPLVIKELQSRVDAGEQVVQHWYPDATVVQSDLVGFTQLVSSRPPIDVVCLIRELFGLFDALADEYAVYKVETVGDAYIAAQAREPLSIRNSPLDVVRFGLRMAREVTSWAAARGETVSCRVGVHSGECVGGIVGRDMQRYHLFGTLMTALEVLESTAPAGRVQVSGACRKAVLRELRESRASNGAAAALDFEERAEPTLTTSKGDVHDYHEVGGRTYLVRADPALLAATPSTRSGPPQPASGGPAPLAATPSTGSGSLQPVRAGPALLLQGGGADAARADPVLLPGHPARAGYWRDDPVAAQKRGDSGTPASHFSV